MENQKCHKQTQAQILMATSNVFRIFFTAVLHNRKDYVEML